jgi:hypothetical protein
MGHIAMSTSLIHLEEGWRWRLALPVVGGEAQLHGLLESTLQADFGRLGRLLKFGSCFAIPKKNLSDQRSKIRFK